MQKSPRAEIATKNIVCHILKMHSLDNIQDIIGNILHTGEMLTHDLKDYWKLSPTITVHHHNRIPHCTSLAQENISFKIDFAECTVCYIFEMLNGYQ